MNEVQIVDDVMVYCALEGREMAESECYDVQMLRCRFANRLPAQPKMCYNKKMKYEESEKLSAKAFRRKCGMKRKTFEKAVEILKKAEAERRKRGGCEGKLIIENQLLLTLEYLREYRTYFHIALDFGVHETTAIRICRWVEETLVKDGAFSLPGKKALVGDGRTESRYEVILIDATESPIERPKRGKNSIIPGRKNDTH